MPHLVTPMSAEPPADYVQYVAEALPWLRPDAARMVGERDAQRIYPEALSDLARHWRRLPGRRRPGRLDAADAFLRRRLLARVAQWRDDNGYPVEVRHVFLGDPPGYAGPGQDRGYASGTAPPDSVARRMAALLPPTQREELGRVAEAEIAWVHAYQRYCRVRVSRHIAGVVLVVGGIVQVMSRLSDAGQ